MSNGVKKEGKFKNNNLINVLDLSDLSNVKLHFTQNSLNNMTNLQHVIVNHLVELTNISEISFNGTPNIKAIYRDRKDKDTNIIRTVEPQKINITSNRSIVVMDIPYNTNVLYPNPSLFTV